MAHCETNTHSQIDRIVIDQQNLRMRRLQFRLNSRRRLLPLLYWRPWHRPPRRRRLLRRQLPHKRADIVCIVDDERTGRFRVLAVAFGKGRGPVGGRFVEGLRLFERESVTVQGGCEGAHYFTWTASGRVISGK